MATTKEFMSFAVDKHYKQKKGGGMADEATPSFTDGSNKIATPFGLAMTCLLIFAMLYTLMRV